MFGNMIRMTYSELFIAAPCIGVAIFFLFELLYQGDSPHQRIIDILVFSLVLPLLPIFLYIFEEITFLHLMGALLWYLIFQGWLMDLDAPGGGIRLKGYGEGTTTIVLFSTLVCALGACLALLYLIFILFVDTVS